MIFVTIGTQAPFDRLIKTIDEIAPLFDDIEIVAQVSTSSTYKVKNIKIVEFVPPVEFDKYFNQASLLISHAGMGTIISALKIEKPIIVMPRLAKFGEHRNNHQLATAERFNELKYIHVAFDEHELKDKVISLVRTPIKPMHKIGQFASDKLISSVKDFIFS